MFFKDCDRSDGDNTVKLPSIVTTYLAEQMITYKSAACVRVTASGACISASGNLDKYGLSSMSSGEQIDDHLPFLEGFFPLATRAEALPQIHLSADFIIDVHIIPIRPLSKFAPQSVLTGQLEEGWILLLDSTAETVKQQTLQQQGNELSLIRQQQAKLSEQRLSHRFTRLTTHSVLSQVTAYSSPSPASKMTFSGQDSSILSNLLSALNILILECRQSPNNHDLSIIGQLPEWAAHYFECFKSSASTIPAEQFSPFLDNFLYDADSCWQGSASESLANQTANQSAQPLRSGVWTETDLSNKDIHLEAVALSIERRNVILIELLDVASSEKFQWLQTARQDQLDFIAERKESESQIRQAISYDELTGLPNRSLFLSKLEAFFEESQQSEPQQSESQQFALVVLNLDRFQLLNNSLGSEVGDQVLIAVAERIKACLRPFDIPVRFSSDEFGILLGKIQEEDAIAITQKLLDGINQPFIINDNKTCFTASAGIALSAPWYRHSRDLIRDASLAMQAAKSQCRGHYVVFKRDMRTRAFELWSLESALDTAIERGELTMFYQPIVNLTYNKVEGFEALIRWNHPQKGYIPPIKFIPLAEESGRILAIDNWVINEACRTIQRWQQQTGNQAYLNINISPQHFEQGNLFEAVQSAMKAAQIPPASICLEITESCLLTDTQSVVETLNRIKALGVQIAIDDFGTGYASLGYLQDLPLDKLKIDGYFIEMMESNGSEIVNTVVELAHRLKFNVTAERVETVEQYQMLKQLGCDMGQGYLFSKPLPPAEAQSLINAQMEIPMR